MYQVLFSLAVCPQVTEGLCNHLVITFYNKIMFALFKKGRGKISVYAHYQLRKKLLFHQCF